MQTIRLTKSCVEECSAPGDRQKTVEFWMSTQMCIREIGGVSANKTRCYLRETGGWSDEELAHTDVATLHERLLWVVCGEIKEDNAGFDELAGDEILEWYLDC